MGLNPPRALGGYSEGQLPPRAPRPLIGDTGGFINRAWCPILAGWCWLYALQQSAIGHRDWDFHIVRGGADTGNSRFIPRVSEL